MTKKENQKEENNQPKIIQKGFEEILAESEAKLTQKNYYQTEEFEFYQTVKNKETGKNEKIKVSVPIHFKPLSQKNYIKMGMKPVDDRLGFVLGLCLYNPEKEKIITEKELEPFLEMYGPLSIEVANAIMEEGGFNPEKLKTDQVPF